ncbi:3-deoxy-7-phosphoheptulonate synthase [Micromonospora sp. WMMD1128]|uniref:3-deoxy-7-phosphoheptulonate synthase n=1 Tax=Micromonospora sp. WMMD1128 TaxID=3015150 RepID=UPI00248C90A6|nr:3-deoxy-7-phosphoheptulonate synthase [Micromonospora sp. WMMD1128]WBB73858.1 3-deoxy-7-phosphoheptulonate synthase [Micromonospora sp. WMMD1128]
MTRSVAEREALQQPEWPDPAAVAGVREILANRSGLVSEAECAVLAGQLDRAARGEALVLQAGDCAERFTEAAPEPIAARLTQLTGLAARLHRGSGLPVVPVGRIAGQYAKPRSSAWERLPDGTVLPAYRGDLINRPEADPVSRTPDPHRMLTGYDCAAFVLRQLRRRSGTDPEWSDPADAPLFASHEALLCDYETALERTGAAGRYASSGHLLWIGDRTRASDGWHVRWAAELSNPVGVKIGPSITVTEAVRLSRVLNPQGRPGKVSFIVRLGSQRIRRILPELALAIRRHGAPVLWLCDPMHGNTYRLRSGAKTRPVEAIHDEATAFVRILAAHRLHPAGLHLEVTPEDVTECVAAPVDTPVSPARVAQPRYTSACDPRLNREQADELAAHFAGLTRRR